MKGLKEGYIEEQRSRRDFRSKVASAVLGKVIEKKLAGTKPVYGPDAAGKFGKLGEVEDNAVVFNPGGRNKQKSPYGFVDDDDSSATTSDQLPDPSSYPEGSVAEDDQSGKKYIVQDGQWVEQ